MCKKYTLNRFTNIFHYTNALHHEKILVIKKLIASYSSFISGLYHTGTNQSKKSCAAGLLVGLLELKVSKQMVQLPYRTGTPASFNGY